MHHTTKSPQTLRRGPIPIDPGAKARIDLGMYHTANTAPQFHVEYQRGAVNTVSYHDVYIEHGEYFQVLRAFQNFGNQPVTISIQWRGGGKPVK